LRTPGSPSSKFLKAGDPTGLSPVSLIAVIRDHLISRRGPSRGFYETPPAPPSSHPHTRQRKPLVGKHRVYRVLVLLGRGE